MAVTYSQGPNVLNIVQATVTANADAVTLTRFQTWSYAAIQLTGTWTGTISFEITVDGVNWVAVSATPAASVTTVSSATGNGVWFVQMTGFAGLRARCSAAMTGTAAVTIKSLPSQG